jgi:hypothetical protein
LIDPGAGVGHVGQGAPKLHNRLPDVRPVFAEHGVDVRQRLVCFGGSLPEIIEQRLPADLVHVVQRCFHLGAIFFNHAAGIRERGGKVRAVLRAEQIVYARTVSFTTSIASAMKYIEQWRRNL